MEDINWGPVALLTTIIYMVVTYYIVRYAVIQAHEILKERERQMHRDENIRILKLLRDNKITKQEFDVRLSQIPADIAYNDVL